MQTVGFSQGNISGFVYDAETGEKIINAVIYQEATTNSTVSNNFGFYTLHFTSKDTAVVKVSYIGYKTAAKRISIETDKTNNFYLYPDNKVEEVIISADLPIEKRNEIGILEIPVNQLNKIPTIGAESDVMKAFQLMPGIQSGDEGSNNLYVRGGSPDENLILLDDVPLYYVNHLGGFVSVFNSDVIKRIKLIKGGFPARYNGRLSSVIDVRMKDGDMKSYHGNIGIGIISSKIGIEGPLKKDKSSFLFSARGFLWDFLFLRPMSKIASDATTGYNFYDLNAKLNRKINEKNNLYFSFYKGDDNVVVRYKETGFNKIKADNVLRWGNTLISGRWNRIFNSKLFSNITFYYTKYRYESSINYKDKTKNQDFSYKFSTAINDLSLKSDFEYNMFRFWKIRFGSNSVYHHFKPGFSYYRFKKEETNIDTSYGYTDIYVPENNIYLENEIQLGKLISVNIGTNLSYYYVEDTGFFSPEPRALLNFKTSKHVSLKLSYTEMQQKVHLLTSNTVSLPMDIWVPATSVLPPSNSKQYAFGLYKTFVKENLEFSIETYYKTSDNLIAYKEGATYRSVAKSWIDKLETGGTGISYGVEFLLQKKQGRLTGWISYTYAKTNRKFTNINFGHPYPFKYDRRHDVSIVTMYQLNKKIDISAAWVFGSGYAYTLAVGKYEAVNNGTSNIQWYNRPDIWYNENILTYADKNANRMRPYHRLDLAVNIKKQKIRSVRIWSISIYNAYNRQNPYYYYTKIKKNQIKLYQQSLFPIIPSVSYRLEF